jgi:hypothetical protein
MGIFKKKHTAPSQPRSGPPPITPAGNLAMGRPKAAKIASAPPVPPGDQAKAPIVHSESTRCPACGSTDRTGYHNTAVQEHCDVDAAGRPYTHILRRWCTCKSCGQQRIDRTYENRPARTS